jgi:hypothetical protein
VIISFKLGIKVVRKFYLKHLVHCLPFIATTPTQTPGEIVACAERYNANGGLFFELYAI